MCYDALIAVRSATEKQGYHLRESDLPMMNELVTGGAGYIAGKALFKAGFCPISFDNLSLGNAEGARYGTLVVGDLAESACVRKVIESHDFHGALQFAGSVGGSAETQGNTPPTMFPMG